MRRRWLLAGAATAIPALAAVGVTVGRTLSAVGPADSPEVVFTVPRGQSLTAIAAGLEREGLVRSAAALEWLARFRGLAGALRAGEHRLSPGLRAGEILSRLAGGPLVTYPVMLPEGFTAVQVAERLHAQQLVDPAAFLAVVRDPETPARLGVEGETLEGYLFPETYRLPRELSPLEISRILVDQFLAVWREIEPLASEQQLSMREVVTLASIVEKETGVPEERRLIASVFRNRLVRGMRLESDPSVIYGIRDFDGNLRRRDLENPDNPYNTYQIRGLPPGPIANPGAGSLRAVVEPARTDFLYFVSRNDGTHRFSRTYREHVIAVNKYQSRRSR